MNPLVLAAVVAAGDGLHTLAGVTLGSNVTQVLAEHPGAKRSANGSARWWRWSRHGGSTVIVTADDIGNITRVEFQAGKGHDEGIDLPCVGAFPVQGSDVKLNLALAKTACSAFNGVDYGMPDRSLVDVHFNGPGNGRLAEATWYHPSDENPTPVGHMHSLIDYLRPAVRYAGGVARIYYTGECATEDHSDFSDLSFPSVWLERPLPRTTGIDAVRQIFRDDPNVTVMQDRSGMPRITIGNVASGVLQMGIPSLSLSAEEQYTALSAIDKITMTAETSAKQRGLPFRSGQYVIDHLVSRPANGAPHLPATMQKITIDEALDALAKAFKGIVTYGVCMQPDGKNLFWLGFIYDS